MSTIPFAAAVVVAAGSSSRMGGIDKLHADLAGRPLLQWSAAAMRSASSVGQLIVVAGADQVRELIQLEWLRALDARVIAGGARRQDSVAAGVRASALEVVLVHDGARPLVSAALVDAVASAAARHGAAVPVVPVADSLKHVDGSVITRGAPRDHVARAQTPQGARRELLLAAVEAYSDGAEAFGDEAELLAKAGIMVVTVPGEAMNLKVTVAEDLSLVRAIAGHAAVPVRYAMGSDSHPFGAEDGLRLGGIEMAEAPRLAGHSDGDAALHAVCDALLAAGTLGDLGRLFPAGDPVTRGIDSRELVRTVLALLAQAGRRPVSVDLTITGARPRLGAARLDRMAVTIARLLEVPEAVISVKAATGNLGGPEGAGLAIAATVLAGVAAR